MNTCYVYILTNKNKTVLYLGVTNDLSRRLSEHINQVGNINAFTRRYNCYHLIYFEEHDNIENAIEREKKIKGWRREKKEKLIESFNPDWKFLEGDFFV
ncbi:GIY-YIG nuclease family protein [Marinifilum fragile]|uniref:GIY-YIG nuclease family protein n=1 Tax=Marinifilum fragile TaxID=570161 RepID=UPI002AA70BB1|nr:GIY-YIG nuclease family protein [Marinifilum fragile]